MNEQIESQLFIVADLSILLCDGERQTCIRWTNGHWVALDVWEDD